jgi:hypothetical protein
MVAPLVLGFAGVAVAGNPTDPPPVLPTDQIVLNGSCISAAQVLAAAQQTGEYVGAGQCAGPQVPSVLPADQITLTGCVTPAQEVTAAQDALDLYAAGDAPAGILVNGNWVPAGIATNAGGYAASNACP